MRNHFVSFAVWWSTMSQKHPQSRSSQGASVSQSGRQLQSSLQGRGLLLALFCQIWRELDFGRSLQTDDEQDVCCGACGLLELCKAGLLRGPLYVATVELRELLTTFFSIDHFPFFFKLSPLCICSNDQPTCEIDRDGVCRDWERKPLSTSKRGHLVL